ncbi:hypothetical protein PIB30_081184 [Stylosanthes scabra]|uniref:Uncharacterized protein n=1 Tax=Stylosanthes scabra TaxID=79078 RepID=A0ABU6TR63_9FABA|nr:hypothetical protein [Stylosanthes scabra]
MLTSNSPILNTYNTQFKHANTKTPLNHHGFYLKPRVWVGIVSPGISQLMGFDYHAQKHARSSPNSQNSKTHMVVKSFSCRILRKENEPLNEWQNCNFTVWSVSGQTFSEGVRSRVLNIFVSTPMYSIPFYFIPDGAKSSNVRRQSSSKFFSRASVPMRLVPYSQFVNRVIRVFDRHRVSTFHPSGYFKVGIRFCSDAEGDKGRPRYNRCRRFHCGDGSPTRRSSKAPKTPTLIRLSRSLGNSRKVCYRETNTRFLESVGPITSPRSTFPQGKECFFLLSYVF